MTPNRTITVSFPLGLFGTATMNVPPSREIEKPEPELPMDRELLDMPNVIPEIEVTGEGIDFDDVVG